MTVAASLLVLIAIILGLFNMLCRKMKQDNVPSPPELSYLWLFIVYGGVLILLLNQVLWKNDGIDLLGMVLAIYIAPMSNIVLGIYLHSYRKLSWYHFCAWALSFAYVCVPAAVLIAMIILR